MADFFACNICPTIVRGQWPQYLVITIGRYLLLLMVVGKPVVNLIKHFTIIIYDSRVVLTRKLPILRL